jgi:hypothetical protein
MLIQVLRNAKEGILSAILLSLWSIIFFSGLFFFAETYKCEYNPQSEKLFRYNSKNELEECRVHSIIDAYWWALVTIQCTGYGDLTPATYMGKIINGCIVLIANMIFMIPSAILTIEFLDLIIQKRKNEVIEKAIIKCENKIEKVRQRNFQKELKNIFPLESIQNNANTFIKYYNLHGSVFGSEGSFNSNSDKSINIEKPKSVIGFFKLKKGNSMGYPFEKDHNGSVHSSNESYKHIKSSSNYIHQNHIKFNIQDENIKSINSNILNNDDNINKNNNKILKSSKIIFDEPTTTIKYGVGNKFMNISRRNSNPEILKLNRIIENQRYLNKITTESKSGFMKPIKMEGYDNYDNANSSIVKNHKNSKREIEVEVKLGQYKYMSLREISKELYKLSMDYYAQCDDEFSEVDEQSGTLYLLMKCFEKSINQIRKFKAS